MGTTANVLRSMRRLGLALALCGGSAQAQSLTACVGAGCDFVLGTDLTSPCRIADVDAGSPVRRFDRACLAARRTFTTARAPLGCDAARGECTEPAPAARVSDGATIETVEVFGLREAPDVVVPRLEQRVADALNRGNPEIAGGKVRHGVFYALGMYWGSDPLTFLYYNLRYGLAGD